MKPAANNKELLDREYAAYRKVYGFVVYFYYISVGLLFIFLCMQVAAAFRQSLGWFVFCKALAAALGIWYLFYLCDTEGGLLKLLRMWEKSLLQRIRQEEAMEALRTGGLYFVDDTEMALVDDKYLVPRDRLK